jgi:hypothetical protein
LSQKVVGVEVNGGQEVVRALLVTGGDRMELLDLGKEILVHFACARKRRASR